MYRYLIRKNPYILLFLIVSPLRALTSVALAGALGMAIDYATSGELGAVWKYVVVFGVYILIDLAVDAADQYARFQVTKRAMVTLKKDLDHKLSRMCYLHFFGQNTADYISNMTSDTEMLRESYFRILLGMYADFLCCAVALAVLLFLSPVLGIFVVAVSLLQTLVPLIFSKRLERAGEVFSNSQERHMKALKESLSAFLTTKIFHIEDKMEKNYVDAMSSAEDNQRKLNFLLEWSNSLSYVFNQVALLGVFLIGAVLNIKGVVTVAEVVAASQLISYISNPVQWLNSDLADLKTVKAPAKKLKAILDEPEDLGGSEDLHGSGGELSLRELRFSYADREILSGVNYTFQSGKKYLITGASGSGKSTLLRLIAGLRDDYRGSITLAGTELRALSRRSLTENICEIEQEPFLFDDTLYNNICLYEDVGEDKVLEAIRRVELGGLFNTLTDGLRTPMGENASFLSGGEKQRVVIARAILRNTPILLLDESTSHLDPHTAAEIERMVLGLAGVTVLLVSHNATETASSLADEVLELRDGKLRRVA